MKLIPSTQLKSVEVYTDPVTKDRGAVITPAKGDPEFYEVKFCRFPDGNYSGNNLKAMKVFDDTYVSPTSGASYPRVRIL